jgi:hypothetical protein
MNSFQHFSAWTNSDEQNCDWTGNDLSKWGQKLTLPRFGQLLRLPVGRRSLEHTVQEIENDIGLN